MEIHKKSNKENSRPKAEQQKVVTSFIKRTVPGLTAPLKSKNDQRDGTAEKRAEPTKKSAVAKPAAEAKKAATLTQTFLSQQSSNYKKLLAQGPKPVSSAPPKSLPGTYKGKVVQSKVDCFRKPGDATTTTTEKRVFTKPTVPKTVGPAPATLSRVKSKSVTTLPVKTAPAVSQTQPRRPKSVTDVPLSRPLNKTTRGQTQTISTVRQFQVIKRPAAARAVPPPSRPMAGPRAPAGSARPAPSAVKKSEQSQNASKPPVGTSQRPARKPVTSTLSHTRVGMETTEERRAKLAEWLAKKGKTLKRPPIQSVQPVQRAKPLAQPSADPQPGRKAAGSRPAAREPGPVVPEAAVGPSLAPEAEPLTDLHPGEGEGLVTSSPAKVMNTTLDMVDNCDLELPEVDTDVNMENLVVNLCDALDAMEMPSTCRSNEQCAAEKHLATEQGDVEIEVQVGEEKEEDEEEDEEEEEQDEVGKEKEDVEEEFADKTNGGMPTKEDSSEDSESEIEADSIEVSESDSDTKDDDHAEAADVVKREVKVEDDEDEDDDEENNCGNTTPECNGASVVKYSVRTTPFLQSVKKRIDGGCESSAGPSSCGGSSRRHRHRQTGAIGDLKFLTPVRRSRRIERQSSRLPAALTEHDPCVTSLAELARLEGDCSGIDNEANAYIYRRNPALLDELPGDLTRL